MSVRRIYETTFIVNAALEDSDIEAVISKVTGYITNHGGDVQETERWGRRRLAYPINKKYNGYYVHLVFEASSDSIPVLERFLVLEDTVLRSLTLILPDKLREYRHDMGLEQGGYNKATFANAIRDDKAKPEAKPKKEEKPKKEKAEAKPAVEESKESDKSDTKD